MFSVLRSTRLAARPLVQRAPRAVASLHASARARAMEDPFNDPQIIEMRAKIQNHEGTKAAIMKLGELMQAKGESSAGDRRPGMRGGAGTQQCAAGRSFRRP